MIIKINKELSMEANVAITTVASVLSEMFDTYAQAASMEVAESVQNGQVVLPIIAYGPRLIKLRARTIKDYYCNARFTVYSIKPNDTNECLRFIHKERTGALESILEVLPPMIGEAYFDTEGESTIIKLIDCIGAIASDEVNYFYNTTECDGSVTHSLAVVHEFKKDKKTNLVATAYFSIVAGKNSLLKK